MERGIAGIANNIKWAPAPDAAAGEGPKRAKLTERGGRMATRVAWDGDVGLSCDVRQPRHPGRLVHSATTPASAALLLRASRLRVRHDTPPARPRHTPAIAFLLRVHTI
jgi:hypothetical protein